MDSEFFKRVAVASLPHNIGRSVTLLGDVVQVDHSGRSFTMKASDKDVITVQLEDPVQDMIEGIVEVQGVVSNQSTIRCKNYNCFSSDVSDKFDLALYNEVITLTENQPTHYEVMA